MAEEKAGIGTPAGDSSPAQRDQTDAVMQTGLDDRRTKVHLRGAKLSLPFILRLIWATAIVPVVTMGAGGCVSFGIALVMLGRVVVSAATNQETPASLIVELVRVIDASLVGVVMIVLAFGIYELLIGPVARPLPAALSVRDLLDLEERVLRTVIVIIAVTAVEAIVEPAPHVEQLEIVGSAAVVILALAVFLRFESRRHGERSS
jgi:uncharacterized membrane protein YqhA